MSQMKTSTITHDAYEWPRTVPLSAKPAPPPITTGTRIFCPTVETTICREGDYEDQKRQSKCSKKTKQKDRSALMSRLKFMILNRTLKSDFMGEYNKRVSMYHIDYVTDGTTFENLMDRMQKPSKDLAKKNYKVQKSYADPLYFKVKNDKKCIIV